MAVSAYAVVTAAFIDNVKVPIDSPPPHYPPMHELFFVFDYPIQITDASGTQTYANCVVSVSPFCKHYSQRSSDYIIPFSFASREDSDVTDMAGERE